MNLTYIPFDAIQSCDLIGVVFLEVAIKMVFPLLSCDALPNECADIVLYIRQKHIKTA